MGKPQTQMKVFNSCSTTICFIIAPWSRILRQLNVPIEAAKTDEPSEEDLARIEEFKKKGWI